jgi:hypothetical protein
METEQIPSPGGFNSESTAAGASKKKLRARSKKNAGAQRDWTLAAQADKRAAWGRFDAGWWVM